MNECEIRAAATFTVIGRTENQSSRAVCIPIGDDSFCRRIVECSPDPFYQSMADFGANSATGNAQSADAGNERETYDAR